MRNILKCHSGTHSGTGLKWEKVGKNGNFGGGGEKLYFDLCVKCM
jgi:hypothetical protein